MDKFKFPFYFNSAKNKNNFGFPKTVTLNCYYDERIDAILQQVSPKLNELLNLSYTKGSVLTGGMSDEYIGRDRVNSAINFIKKNFPDLASSQILEIGAGEGTILKELVKLGGSYTALEPGPQINNLKSSRIKKINDFFPTKKLTKKFDLILHFNVLEHVINPIAFLENQKKLLNKDGSIIFSFPDCSHELSSGDISMFTHQHISYFGKFSMQKIAVQVGLKLVNIEKSQAKGMFFCKMTNSQSKFIKSKYEPKISPHSYFEKIDRFNKKILNFLGKTPVSKIAVYCPIKAQNFLFLNHLSDCRLIDDNLNLQQKHLPALDKKIESFAELEKNPPLKILVYSWTFGDQIVQKCKLSDSLKKIPIYSISDIKNKN